MPVCLNMPQPHSEGGLFTPDDNYLDVTSDNKPQYLIENPLDSETFIGLEKLESPTLTIQHCSIVHGHIPLRCSVKDEMMEEWNDNRLDNDWIDDENQLIHKSFRCSFGVDRGIVSNSTDMNCNLDVISKKMAINFIGPVDVNIIHEQKVQPLSPNQYKLFVMMCASTYSIASSIQTALLVNLYLGVCQTLTNFLSNALLSVSSNVKNSKSNVSLCLNKSDHGLLFERRTSDGKQIKRNVGNSITRIGDILRSITNLKTKNTGMGDEVYVAKKGYGSDWSDFLDLEDRRSFGEYVRLLMFPVHKEHTLDPYFSRMLHRPSFGKMEQMQCEWLRLGSFLHWPTTALAFPIKLAKSGFYYTGVSDDVACYSCGGHIKNWTYPMVPMEVHKRFFPRCLFVMGTCKENVPIETEKGDADIKTANGASNCTSPLEDVTPEYTPRQPVTVDDVITAIENMPEGPSSLNIFNTMMSEGSTVPSVAVSSPSRQESEPQMTASDQRFKRMEDVENRKKSFQSWNHDEVVKGEELALAGLFYQGMSDRVQCAWCKGVLHKWKVGDDPMTEHRKFYPHCTFVRNAVLTEATSTNSDESSSASSVDNLGVMSKVPKHPNYATVASREKSFLGWPSQLYQTPRMLADAGFFYVGFGDCVKCFMCNGGLRNWAAQDVPWEEHAQWFQDCEYVRMHGRGAGAANGPSCGKEVGKGDASPSTASTEDANPNPEVTSMIQDMGYDKIIIDGALFKYKHVHKDFTKLTVQSLMDVILDMEQTEHKESNPEPVSYAETTVAEKSEPSSLKAGQAMRADFEKADTEQMDPKSLLEENRSLKEKTVCKICMEYAVSIVFLPCGHLVSCAQCAPALKLCPICRAKVKGRVKTFMS